MSDFKPYDPNAQPDDDNGFEPPADGTYKGCTLVSAKALTSKAGNDGVLLEWENTDGYKWAVWNGFKSEKQSAITWNDVSTLGVNPVDIGDLEQLHEALQSAVGGYYDLAVKTNGNFRNTYINGPSVGANPVVSGQSTLGASPPAATPEADETPIPF